MLLYNSMMFEGGHCAMSFLLHVICGRYMLMIIGNNPTEIVETGITILIFHEAVLWAFSMTGKLHVTLLALAGKRTVLQTAELLLHSHHKQCR